MRCAILTVVFFSLTTGRTDGQDRSRFLRWAHQDASSLVSTLAPAVPAYLVLSAGVVLPSSQFDGPILRGVQSRYDDPFQGFLGRTNELGGPGAIAPVVGIFGISLLTDSPRMQDAAFTSMQSLAFAGALAKLTKMTFGRQRPEDVTDTGQFNPFSGGSSFPSGHTAAAFAIVTPWVLYYRTPAAYGLFVLSTGTAVARVARNKHWPTDVVAGAALGFFTARWLSNRHMRDSAGATFRFRPTFVLGEPGVGLSINLR